MRVELFILASVSVGALLAWLPKRNAHLNNLGEQLAALPHGRLIRLSAYAPDDIATPAADGVWAALGGARGLLQLYRDLGHVINILQICASTGLYSLEDAHRAYSAARLQRFYTLVALIEGMLCSAIPSVPHVAAAAAVYYHWVATLETLNLCEVEDAPACMKKRGLLI